MSPRALRTIAGTILAVSCLMWLGSAVLLLLMDWQSAATEVAFLGSFILFPAFGMLIAIRRPDNHYGLVFSWVGLVWTINNFADGYVTYALDRGGLDSLPLTTAALWVFDWSWFPGMALIITFPLMLFPTGRVPGPGWRFLPWFAAIVIAIGTLALATAPGLLDEYDESLGVQNPLGLDVLGQLPSIVIWICLPLLILSALASAASLVVRFRRAAGIERLQLKWFMLAGALLAAATTTNILAYAYSSEAGEKSSFLFVSIVALPAAAGIAVLRYRLYDIDRIINRTLVYGLLTATLGAIYIGLVVGLQALLNPLSGGSDLAIVATTLVVAALFLPARTRIQAAVDRRFNRRSYDAARTVEAFALRLREQIDLDTLRGELGSVLDETMQPASASVWLRTRPEA